MNDFIKKQNGLIRLEQELKAKTLNLLREILRTHPTECKSLLLNLEIDWNDDFNKYPQSELYSIIFYLLNHL